jgi:hypothetical protein
LEWDGHAKKSARFAQRLCGVPRGGSGFLPVGGAPELSDKKNLA